MLLTSSALTKQWNTSQPPSAAEDPDATAASDADEVGSDAALGAVPERRSKMQNIASLCLLPHGIFQVSCCAACAI
jgi:hypothetical protein